MFLTPNGRLDINMNACISIKEYLKKECLAAWTIRSMLETIIAFFPIKEDHDEYDLIGVLESALNIYNFIFFRSNWIILNSIFIFYDVDLG